MHLHGDVLERYVAGSLPPGRSTAIDAHVSNCLFCAHAVADRTALAAGWERRGWLGRLVRTDDPVAAADAGEEEFRAEAA